MPCSYYSAAEAVLMQRHQLPLLIGICVSSRWYRYKVPNNKVPNDKIPNNNVPNNKVPK